jgi:hypothetical protein
MERKPYAQIPHEFLDYLSLSKLSTLQLKIAIIILKFKFGYSKNRTNEKFYLSMGKIMELSGIKHKPQVSKSMKILRDNGLINFVHSKDKYQISVNSTVNGAVNSTVNDRYLQSSQPLTPELTTVNSTVNAYILEEFLEENKEERSGNKHSHSSLSPSAPVDEDKNDRPLECAYAEIGMSVNQYKYLVSVYGERKVNDAMEQMELHALGIGRMYKSEFHRLKKWLIDDAKR